MTRKNKQHVNSLEYKVDKNIRSYFFFILSKILFTKHGKEGSLAENGEAESTVSVQDYLTITLVASRENLVFGGGFRKNLLKSSKRSID